MNNHISWLTKPTAGFWIVFLVRKIIFMKNKKHDNHYEGMKFLILIYFMNYDYFWRQN